ncbi:hypothetical protein KO516_22160 [Citreicella sp. C3M06]|uniref:hypothetical protein n=1 Tax=Citreicella sp. C3M06 TaxID=2841564 RepID=UPI001C082104|nr:hypothetical protein [Citreicella sp. C3M06]MBU2963481.1 hypothetical protein [Citreicella sp. C3M06]
MIPQNAERAARLTQALKSLEGTAREVNVQSLLQISDLLPDLISSLDDCAAQIRRDTGEIERLNARVAALSVELTAQRAGRLPTLRPASVPAPASEPPAAAMSVAGAEPKLPAGVDLRKRKTLSENILIFSFDLSGTGPLAIEAYRTTGRTFLKTRADFMRSQTGWRSGSDQYGSFSLFYEDDLDDAATGLTAELSRYCFFCLKSL